MPMKILDPYVGVTGQRGRKDAMECFESEGARRLSRQFARRTMIGVMVGPKTFELPRPGDSSFPTIEHVRRSFINRSMALNTLHYWHPAGTQWEMFEDFLSRLIEGSGKYLHAIQFDMTYPDAAVLERLTQEHPHLRILIQLGGRDSNVLESRERLECWLNAYDRLVDDVLVDLSGGRGQLLDVDKVLERLEWISDISPSLQLAVAGGLEANSVFDLKPIVERYPKVSWDAQGKVRLPKEEGGGLHFPRVHAYQHSSAELLEWCRGF